MTPSPEIAPISLLATVRPDDGFDLELVATLARALRATGAARLAICDLGPALAAAGLAYADAPARAAAVAVLTVLGRASGLPLLAPGPDHAAPGAEAAGLAPLPSLVVATESTRTLSRAVALAVPPDLLVATRAAVLGQGAVPGWLGLEAADHTAITRTLPQATSLAHAAALAGRLHALAALDAALLARAEAIAFGTDAPPDFLPEALVAALAPGASAEALAAMASACRPLLAEAPFLPAARDATTTRLPRPRRIQPAPLPLFPEAPAQPTPAAARAKNLRLVG